MHYRNKEIPQVSQGSPNSTPTPQELQQAQKALDQLDDKNKDQVKQLYDQVNQFTKVVEKEIQDATKGLEPVTTLSSSLINGPKEYYQSPSNTNGKWKRIILIIILILAILALVYGCYCLYKSSDRKNIPLRPSKFYY